MEIPVMVDEEKELHDVSVDAPILESDAEAEMCAQKIKKWERYKEFWTRHYQNLIQRETERADRNISYQNYLLRNYFARLPHRNTKTTETYDLPTCSLVEKRAYDNMTISEENKPRLLLWLAERGVTKFTETKTVEKLKWNECKKSLSIIDGHAVDNETGEVVDMVTVEHHDPEFVVKIREEKDNDDD